MADAEENLSSAVGENVVLPADLTPSSCENEAEVGAGSGAEVAAVNATTETEVKRAPSASHQTSKEKIELLLKATGDAPIMKQKKWSVEAEKKVGGIIQFIKKYLKLEAHDTLFLYVNQSFAPSPDQILRNLYECFGAEGKLVLHYCKTQAWG